MTDSAAPKPTQTKGQSSQAVEMAVPSRSAPKRYVCEVCGASMLSVHCKIRCQVCGYMRDCSDP